MKQESRHSSGRKLRGLFCVGLSAVLAAGIALSGTAANTKPVSYDVKVCGAFTHTAALSEGSLYVWGTNEQGQFPNASSERIAYAPEPCLIQEGVADVAVSNDRTLTVSDSGELRSYGLEPATEKAAPEEGTVIASDAKQVEASNTFAAYIDGSGALYTWGQNYAGQLGNGSDKDSTTPVQVFDGGVKKVSLGNAFALALMEDGSVYSWGQNNYMQLGYEGDGSAQSSPKKIADSVADIDAGFFHACLLKKDGTVWTCGDNTYSQAGVGDIISCTPLTQILTGIRSISAGSSHNFAIATDGTVYNWGYGQSGQLGAGSDLRQDTPALTELDFVQIFACDDNSFGVSADGNIFSFGDNTNYLLAKSDAENASSPVRVLDKDMAWIYDADNPSGEENNTPDETDDPATPGNPGAPAEPGVSTEPEIVVTPFINGYNDGTFQPGKPVTRAEFLKMLVLALDKEFDGSKVEDSAPSFSDVPANAWYASYVAYAEQKKLVGGYPDGTFKPENPISRAEASKMAIAFLGLDTAAAPDADYSDVAPDFWAAAEINALTQANILGGDGNGSFRPQNNITRAEAAKLVACAAEVDLVNSADSNLVLDSEVVAGDFPKSPFTDVETNQWYYPYVLRAYGVLDFANYMQPLTTAE